MDGGRVEEGSSMGVRLRGFVCSGGVASLVG